MSNEKINIVGTNIAEKATMIWNVADMLRGPFNEYSALRKPAVRRFGNRRSGD